MNAVDYAALMERMDRLDARLDMLATAAGAVIGGLGLIMTAMAGEVRSASVAESLNKCADGAIATAKAFARDK